MGSQYQGLQSARIFLLVLLPFLFHVYLMCFALWESHANVLLVFHEIYIWQQLFFQYQQIQKTKSEASLVDFLIKHLGFQQYLFGLQDLQVLWDDIFQPTLNSAVTHLIATISLLINFEVYLRIK